MPPGEDADPRRRRVRAMAEESIRRADPTGWFDRFYASADGDPGQIPWADKRANPLLISWLERSGGTALDGAQGRRALVVGCGLGDDAEQLAATGFHVTAFDISPVAIDWCRRRWRDSPVTYCVADLLDPPAEWSAVFDLVFEALTLQALPLALRQNAIASLAQPVAPGGLLMVICRGCGESDDRPNIPWPLTRTELSEVERHGFETVRFDDLFDTEDPPVRRFRALYRRRVKE